MLKIFGSLLLKGFRSVFPYSLFYSVCLGMNELVQIFECPYNNVSQNVFLTFLRQSDFSASSDSNLSYPGISQSSTYSTQNRLELIFHMLTLSVS